MTEFELRQSVTVSEEEQNGWTIITITVYNQSVSGRYENALWASGYHPTTGLAFSRYKNNLIGGLTNVLIDKLLYPNGRPVVQPQEESTQVA